MKSRRAAGRLLVAGTFVRDLLLRAKHLFVAAILSGPPASRPPAVPTYRGMGRNKKPRRLAGALYASVLSDQVAASALRLRRHHASRPPPANIRPGSPAPAMGPGTVIAPKS